MTIGTYLLLSTESIAICHANLLLPCVLVIFVNLYNIIMYINVICEYNLRLLIHLLVFFPKKNHGS